MALGSLPSDWDSSKIADEAELLNGKASGTGGSWLRVFKTRHIYDGPLRKDSECYVPDERAASVPRRLYLQDGDTLTPNMAHGTIGRVAFVKDPGNNWTTDGQITILRSRNRDRLDPRFLYDWMSTPRVKASLVAMEKGGVFGEKRGQTHLYRSDIGTIDIPLPPIREQRKIAAILSSVDEAIEKTQAVIVQAQVVKKGLMQELLTKGVLGRHRTFKQTELGRIPNIWTVKRLGDLFSDMQYGTSVKCSTVSFGDPVLRIPNVVGGTIDSQDLKYATLTEEERARYALRQGDLLFVRTNGNPDYVGRCAIMDDRDGMWLFASYLIRARVDQTQVVPSFVHLCCMAGITRDAMRGSIRTSAGNYNINTKGISSAMMVVPPLEEQRDLVAVATALESRVISERAFASALKQLKSALSTLLLTGELRVRPDPEPA